MKTEILEEIIKLRILVGFLGEAKQKSWWKCSFYAKESEAFLAPVFSRTTELARYHGVNRAASIIHDSFIGVGKDVYHLFRLPEILEKRLQDLLINTDIKKTLQKLIETEESASNNLEELSKKAKKEGEGPVRIGNIAELEKPSSWLQVAALYHSGFNSGSKSFPFFSRNE